MTPETRVDAEKTLSEDGVEQQMLESEKDKSGNG